MLPRFNARTPFSSNLHPKLPSLPNIPFLALHTSLSIRCPQPLSIQFSRIKSRKGIKTDAGSCCMRCKWSLKNVRRRDDSDEGTLPWGRDLRVQKYNRLMQMARQHQKRFLLTGQDKYSKISHRDKILLIKRVIFDSVEIKETAQALNINYSTAKTLMRKFKKHGEQLDEEVIVGISRWYDVYCQERSRCGYRAVESSRLRKNSKKERRTQEQETNQPQGTRGGASEQPTPIAIFQQVLFRQ